MDLAAEIDSVVHLIRLRPAGTTTVVLFVVGIACALAGIVVGCLLQIRREARRRRDEADRSIQQHLRASGLDRSELDLLDLLASRASTTAARCAAAAPDFDRGVEAVLSAGEEGTRPDLIERIGNLRRKLGLDALSTGRPIESTRSLAPNLHVHVTIRDSIGGPSVGGTVLSVQEDALTIRLLGSPGIARFFRPPCEVEVFFIRALDAGYSFTSRVAAVRELEVPFLVLHHSRSIERLQKRGFARVEIDQPVRFRRIPVLRSSLTGIPAAADEGGEVEGRIRSLSASGIRLDSPIALLRGECIRLVLPFLPGNHGTEPCFARVVRNRGLQAQGLRFVGMPPALQAAIFQYVRSVEVREIREKIAVDETECRIEGTAADKDRSGQEVSSR